MFNLIDGVSDHHAIHREDKIFLIQRNQEVARPLSSIFTIDLQSKQRVVFFSPGLHPWRLRSWTYRYSTSQRHPRQRPSAEHPQQQINSRTGRSTPRPADRLPNWRIDPSSRPDAAQSQPRTAAPSFCISSSSRLDMTQRPATHDSFFVASASSVTPTGGLIPQTNGAPQPASTAWQRPPRGRHRSGAARALGGPSLRRRQPDAARACGGTSIRRRSLTAHGRAATPPSGVGCLMQRGCMKFPSSRVDGSTTTSAGELLPPVSTA